MPTTPEALRAALVDAGQAHHPYEETVLRGTFDEDWPVWYAAFLLGRLPDVAAATDAVRLLALITEAAHAHEEHSETPWPEFYARHIAEGLPT